MVYKCLVLSGGAFKGFNILGALHYYYENNLIDNVIDYIGTSIGSIICYLLIIGYTPIELLNESLHLNLNNLVDINLKTSENPQSFLKLINNLINNYGFLNLDQILNIIITLSNKKIKYIPSLLELYETTNKNLIICTYNLSKMQVEYINKDNNPHLSCLHAIKMSCNIPLIFDKCVYNNNLYIDGAYHDNFPIKYAVDNLHYFNKYEILGISIKKNKNNFKLNEINFINYIKLILYIPFNNDIHENNNFDICKIHEIDCGDEFTLNINNNKMLEFFNIGYNFIKTCQRQQEIPR
jgi:predicted acylesterase/phospholipase RssA